MALVKNATIRLPELGKVKIGEKEVEERVSARGAKWRAPRKLDHFLLTTNERDSKGDLKVDLELMEALAPAGCERDERKRPKLRELPITLLGDSLDDCISQSYCWYPDKAIGARCDGESCTWFIGKAGKLPEPKTVPCNGEHTRPGWKLHTRFDFAIRSPVAKWGGFYSFRTTSEITAQQLPGTLGWLSDRTYGAMAGLPLMLVVKPVQVAPDGKPTTVYVVHVELRGMELPDIQKRALETVQTRHQMGEKIVKTLRLLRAPGVDETPEESEEIVSEFHPEVLAVGPQPIPAEAPAGGGETITVAAVAVEGLPAPVAPAPATTPAPLTLAERIAAARTEEDFRALGAEVTASDDATKGAYFLAREKHLGKPLPPERAARTRRTPPPPPTRAAPVVTPPPAPAPAAAVVPEGDVDPDEIPF